MNNDSMNTTTSSETLPSERPTQPEILKARRPRGFAAMDRAKVSEIASKGGKAAHAKGTAHQFTHDEAVSAGKKGGVAPHISRGGRRVPNTIPAPAAEENASV